MGGLPHLWQLNKMAIEGWVTQGQELCLFCHGAPSLGTQPVFKSLGRGVQREEVVRTVTGRGGT